MAPQGGDRQAAGCDHGRISLNDVVFAAVGETKKHGASQNYQKEQLAQPGIPCKKNKADDAAYYYGQDEKDSYESVKSIGSGEASQPHTGDSLHRQPNKETHGRAFDSFVCYRTKAVAHFRSHLTLLIILGK